MRDVTAYGQGDWRERVGPDRVSPLEERRQRAREAYHDAPGGHATYPETRLDIAIETATRVRITDEVVAEFYPGMLPRDEERARACLWNGLRALGFEVEQ